MSKRKSFLSDIYGGILGSGFLAVLQVNNLSVGEMAEFSRNLRKESISVKFISAGVFKAAVQNSPYSDLSPLLTGPTAIAFGDFEPARLKGLFTLIDKNKRVLVLGAGVDARILGSHDLRRMMDLPSLPQLQAQLVGLLQSPAQTLVSLLNAPSSRLASSLQQVVARGDTEKEANQK